MIDISKASPQWTIVDGDVSRIADAYGLTVLSRGGQPLGGAVNGVARVATDRDDVVFRIHRPWTTVARLEGVHRVQACLRAQGLPIPDVLAARDGHSWTRLHHRLAEVIAYVEGGTEADSWDQFAASFTMLGRLHTALATVDPATVPAPRYSSYAEPGTALAMLAETDEPFRSCANCEGYAEAVALREDARRLWDRLHRERLTYAAELPSSLIHGDFLGGNVQLAAERVIAILDFDRLAWRERIHDLGCSLYCVLGRRHRFRPADEPPSADDLVRLARLVTGYEATAHHPLDAAERAALPSEMARVPLYPIAEAGYLAAAGDTTEAIAQTLTAGRHLPRARWLADNAHLIHTGRRSTQAEDIGDKDATSQFLEQGDGVETQIPG